MQSKSKLIETPLYVYKAGEDTPVLIGELSFIADTQNDFLAQFNYDATYIDRPDAFAIDPLNIPLAAPTKEYSTTNRYHVLGALFDAAPDAWGRKVISAKVGVSNASEKTILLKGNGMGVGELFFSASRLESNPAFLTIPSIDQIEQLASPITQVDEGAKFNPAWENLLVSSWDIGGARPKAIVLDEVGEHWIAKFPRKGETYDRQRVEWANLEMAADIGMDVPERRLIETQYGAVLLVKRFDRSLDKKSHYLSAASVISPSPSIDKRQIDAPIGQATFSYARIADTIQRISNNPSRDLQELYARMVFNVLTHNTDDHLKNTGFLRVKDARDPYAYRLSPLFDVVTQEGSLKHMLQIGKAGRESTIENALSNVRRMRIKEDAAQKIVHIARSVFDRRSEYYDRAGLQSDEVAALERCFTWLRSAEVENEEDENRSAPR